MEFFSQLLFFAGTSKQPGHPIPLGVQMFEPKKDQILVAIFGK
jgi:hypothetical protein